MKYAAPGCALGAALFIGLALIIGSWKQMSYENTKRKRYSSVKYGLLGASEKAKRKDTTKTKSQSYSKAIKEGNKEVKMMKKWAKGSKRAKKELKKSESRLSKLKRARIFGLVTFLFGLIGFVLFLAAGVLPFIKDKLAGKEDLIKTIALWPPIGLAVLLFIFWILFYTGIELPDKPKKLPDHISWSAGIGFSSILFILSSLAAIASGVLTKVLGDKE